MNRLLGSARIAALVCALLVCAFAGAACNGQPAQGTQPSDDNGTPGAGDGPTSESSPGFSGDRAYQLLEKQVEFGPRVPGSEAHRKCGDWLLEELGRWCRRAEAQPFTHTSGTSFPGHAFEMRNIIGVAEPEGGITADTRQVLLLAHWDSRPWADQDPDPTKRNDPVPGANDGASGVAVALEIARCLSIRRAPTAVIVLLTDGEDFGRSWDPGLPEYFLGAKYFAAHYRESDLAPRRGILLDMVGDKTVEICREANGMRADPALIEHIWQTAAGLGEDDVFVGTADMVSDDHLPLIAAGIPTVDLIDWRREVTDVYWHTHADTPDKCSAGALESVGKVVLEVLREGI